MQEQPTPTSAIRVWAGFRLPSLTQADFLSALGETFVPGTLTMLRPLGISGYIVAVLTGDDPDLPGESALIVYSSPDHYKAVTRDNLRGRVHRASHFAVFDMQRSRAVFPVPADTAAAPDAVYLFDQDLDWQTGRVFFAALGRTSGDGDVKSAALKAQGEWRAALEAKGCRQALVQLGAGFATCWANFPANSRLTVDEYRAALAVPSLEGTRIGVKATLLAESLASYSEEAELLSIRQDRSIQFRYLRAPASQMF